MTDQQPLNSGESPAKQRAAVGCLAVVGAAFAGTIAVTVPETAYYTAGLLTAAGVGKVRTWAAGRRSTEADETDEEQPVDIVPVLWDLCEGGQHVRLTQLQEAAGLPDTKTVRALLDEAGIRVRAGVRSGGKNGPGVHMADIPGRPLPESGAPSGRCLCRSGANANTNNEAGEGPRKKFRVERTGQAGVTVYDLSEAHRHHATTKS